MEKYGDLEITILSCLLMKPDLMEKIKLEDKYFIKNKRIWLFMKTFYKRFKNFDIPLMLSVASNKYAIREYIKRLLEIESMPSHFETYQEQLIRSYNETKKNKWIREKVYELATKLYVTTITPDEFKNKIDQMYKDADEIFKEEK